VTGYLVERLPAQERAQHVTGRTEDEDQADLVERAGSVVRQPRQGGAFDGSEQAQDDKGQVVSGGQRQQAGGGGGKGGFHDGIQAGWDNRLIIAGRQRLYVLGFLAARQKNFPV